MPRSNHTKLVRLDVSLSEDRAAELFRASVSPTEFVEFVLREISFDEWIPLFQTKPNAASVFSMDVSAGEAEMLQPVGRLTATKGGHFLVGAEGTIRRSPWTREGFIRFMDVVAASKDFETPLRLLDAYTTLGPSPTSAELRASCGIADENAWQQELRAAKARLTIFARRMGHSPLFPRAQTTDRGRMHPIDPVLYSWLVEWAQGSHGQGSERVEESTTSEKHNERGNERG